MRIVHVATDAALQRHLGGIEHTVGIVRDRAGHAFDPEVAACLVEGGAEILALDDGGSAWEEALAVEPSPPLMLEGDALDRGLAAMGRFADLISPYFAGHSTGVAELASDAAGRCRVDAAGVLAVWRVRRSWRRSPGRRCPRRSGRCRSRRRACARRLAGRAGGDRRGGRPRTALPVSHRHG
jgi:hypothetical protein